MINTHEKLMETVLRKKVSKDNLEIALLKHGYEGENFIQDLLFAIGRTDGYINSPQYHLDGSRDITEEEYFKLLAEEMNNIA